MHTARHSLLAIPLLFCIVAFLPIAGGSAADAALKESPNCDRQERWGGATYLDVTQRPGVLIERGIGSRVDVHGALFPLSLQETTTLSFEFFVYSERSLLLHAVSNDGQHELTAWIDSGTLKVRLAAKCQWLVYVEMLRYSGNITEGTVHTFTMLSKKHDGVTVRVDGQHDLLFLQSSRVLSCWHVDNFYFGGPGPNRQPQEANDSSEFSFKMVGCVRQLTLDRADTRNSRDGARDDTYDFAVFSYRRASTCPYLPTVTAYANLTAAAAGRGA